MREFYRLILEQQPPRAVANSIWMEPSSSADAAMEDTVRRVYQESPAPLQRFLDLLASRPNQWVSTEEVMGATGLTSRQWPQQLSALARRGKKRYAHPEGWPFRSEKLYEPSTRKQVWRYSMPGEYAEVIRSMR